MNLDNYKCIPLVAVVNKEDGKFNFVCQANQEGTRACQARVDEANSYYKEEKYDLTYFSAYIKIPTLLW